MFVISITYVCDISEIEKHLGDHIHYLEKQYSKGIFLASGRKVPRTGGVILAKIESRDKLDQIIAEDPFKKHALANYEVIEFIPTKTSIELEFLRQ